MDEAKLVQSYNELMDDVQKAQMTDTRIAMLAAVDKYEEASKVADRIGGAEGAFCRADTDQILSGCLFNLGNKAAAARAACSSLRAARASGNMSTLVSTLAKCGLVAQDAPGEMARAENESRVQERLSGPPPSYSGLDLSQKGRVSLRTAPAALSRLALAYYEAAVEMCDAALAATGGRGSPVDHWSAPAWAIEAQVRTALGACLCRMGDEGPRSFELFREAVKLWRLVLQKAAPGHDTLHAQRGLADAQSTLGFGLGQLDYGITEAERCLAEALQLSKSVGDVKLTAKILRTFINLCGEEQAKLRPAEAELFRLWLNRLVVQLGRSPETSCSICLEPLAPPADGAAKDAAGGGGSSGAGGLDSLVRVLNCNHQFHLGCLFTWQRKTSSHACPVCKQ